MAVTPHPIIVTAYDTDNTTLLAGAKVYVRNTTKKTTSEEVTTDSNGQAIIDLANLPLAGGQTNEYDSGDKVLIIAYHGNHQDAAMYTVTGSSKAQILYMTYARHSKGMISEKIRTLIVTASGSVAGNATIYAVDDGQVLAFVSCWAAKESVPVIFEGGLSASGGYAIERSAKEVVVNTYLR